MSNLVLYRKYRPVKFSDLIGQDHVRLTLINAIASGRIGHAYLFTGPRGVGKTTVARILARSVNCLQSEKGEPCNNCEICLEFLKGSSLDILEIDAASHTGVDNIREIIDHLKFAPSRSNYKVIIIDEVHMLSKGAFNALLKSLEEPPAHAIFILATTEIHKVPATIISRTQRFDFRRISIADLMKLLKFVVGDNKRAITLSALNQIAEAADGSLRDGLSLLDQVLSFEEGEITETTIESILGLTGSKTTGDFLQLLIDRQTKEAVNFVSNLVYSGRDLYQFQKDFLEYLRKLLLIKIGNQDDLSLTEDVRDRLKSQSGTLELGQITRIIEIFQKAGSELKWVSIPSLPLEIAAVEVVSSLSESKNNIRSIPVASASLQPVRPHESSEKQIVSPTRSDDQPARHESHSGGSGGSPSDGLEPPRKDTENKSDLLNEVKKHWPEILIKIKDYNHSLISSLKLAEPVEVRNNELILVFPYKFHKDAIDARKNRIIVDQVIEDVIGSKIMVKPVLKKEYEVGESKDETLVESALKIMGGEKED